MKKMCLVLIQVLLIILFLSGCNKGPITYPYEVEDVKVSSNEFLCDGKVLIPKGENKFPAVVIVAGSGPVDMDGTVNVQKPYKEIAEKLAEKGIASIRFNKVTNQFTNAVANDYDFTVEDEYFYSVRSAINILKENEKIDSNKIFLIGHSFGSQIIPIMLNEDQTLAGGIIMAGTTLHILDLILEQVKRQSEETYEQYLPYCEYAKSLTEVPAGEEKYIYFGGYSAYYVSYNKINRQMVKDLNCPLLIMQGKLDLQVTINHYNDYKELLKDNTNVLYKEYENLNHLFSDGTNENISNAYKKYHPVSEDVILDIASFIKNK